MSIVKMLIFLAVFAVLFIALFIPLIDYSWSMNHELILGLS